MTDNASCLQIALNQLLRRRHYIHKAITYIIRLAMQLRQILLISSMIGMPMFACPAVMAASLGDPLLDAADMGKAQDVERMISKGDSVNVKNSFGVTPLMRASLKNNISVVNMLLSAKADPNAKDSGGATAMHMAAREGHEKVLEALVRAGANPDSRDAEGWTPLMRASSMGRSGAVQALLDLSADPNLRNDWDETALIYAFKNNHEDAAAKLIASGADTQVVDMDGHSLRQLADLKKNSALANLLGTRPAVLAQEQGKIKPSVSESIWAADSRALIEKPEMKISRRFAATEVNAQADSMAVLKPAAGQSESSRTPIVSTEKVQAAAAVSTPVKDAPLESFGIDKDGEHLVQLGFFKESESQKAVDSANGIWKSYMSKSPKAMASVRPILGKVKLDDGLILYQVRAGYFASADGATKFCQHFGGDQAENCSVLPRSVENVAAREEAEKKLMADAAANKQVAQQPSTPPVSLPEPGQAQAVDASAKKLGASAASANMDAREALQEINQKKAELEKMAKGDNLASLPAPGLKEPTAIEAGEKIEVAALPKPQPMPESEQIKSEVASVVSKPKVSDVGVVRAEVTPKPIITVVEKPKPQEVAAPPVPVVMPAVQVAPKPEITVVQQPEPSQASAPLPQSVENTVAEITPPQVMQPQVPQQPLALKQPVPQARVEVREAIRVPLTQQNTARIQQRHNRGRMADISARSLTPGGDAYAIQISSFQSEDFANHFAGVMRQSNPAMFADRRIAIIEGKGGYSGLYAVNVSPFGTIGEANNACSFAKQQGLDCTRVKTIGARPLKREAERAQDQAEGDGNTGRAYQVLLGGYDTPNEALDTWNAIPLRDKKRLNYDIRKLRTGRMYTYQLTAGAFVSPYAAQSFCAKVSNLVDMCEPEE